MKFFSLSTTAKLYLLTLLVIFGFLALNGAVFAQNSASEERIKSMQLYYSWINSGEYGKFDNNLGEEALNAFRVFLETTIPQDQACLNSKQAQDNSFIGNIKNFFSTLLGQTPEDQPAAALSECKAKIKIDYKTAKKYNRLLKYLQIQAGKPNLCIKADLGVGSALLAHGINPAKVKSNNPKETGRSGLLPLYLCTGNDGGKKVRVVDDSGTKLRLAPDDAAKPEFQLNNLPPSGSLDKLLEKLGLQIKKI